MKQLALHLRLVSMLALLLAIFSPEWAAQTFAAPAAPDVKAILLAALQKSAAAQTYQLESRTFAKGVSDKPTRKVSYSLIEQDELVSDVSAKIKGRDAYIKVKGVIATMLDADPVNGFEMMQIGNNLYIHGPLPAYEAAENKWYVVNAAANQSIAQEFTYGFNQGLDIESLQRADLSLLQSMGKQTLHGKQCDIYGSSNANVVMRAFGSLLSDGLSSERLKSIDEAEFKFWVCNDGYFHQMTMALAATTKDLPSQKVSTRSSLAMFDYNGAFVISAPQNAVRLDTPTVGGSVFSEISGGLTASVFNGGNIRQVPNARGAVLGQLHAGETVALVETTVDGVWYHVTAPETSGWVHVSLLTVPSELLSRVPVNGLARLVTPPSDAPAAQVINGGNRRIGPGTTFEVGGQVRVGEQITLLAKTSNRSGSWYYARCRCGAVGWVHASLLKVDPRDAAKVPGA